MSWQAPLTIMTRQLIGDTDPNNQTFDDSRIQDAIVTAAILVSQEYNNFDNNYLFDLENAGIVPDPTDPNNFDLDAVALFPLKAACILTMNNYQNFLKNGGGVKVRDGDSAVDTSAGFKGYKDIIQLGPCQSYSKLLYHLTYKAIGNKLRIVSTPINIVGFYNTGGYWSAERFYNTLF